MSTRQKGIAAQFALRTLTGRLLTMLFIVTFTAAPAFASMPPKAAIASAHPLATNAGMAILDAGGNAFDAAVAVAAALAVVEPYGSGLGGGGFFLLHDDSTGKDVVIDAREVAPEQAVPDMFQNKKREVDRDWATNGPLAAAIPGVPAGLVHIAARYGRLPLATTLAPAIQLANEGFPVDDRYRQMARTRLEVLRRFSDASRAYLSKGDVPALGTVMRQPDLGATLEMLAHEGHDGFYSGAFAQKLVDAVDESGGMWTLDDLAHYRVIEREPLVGNYRGARIVTIPPPSAGGIALISMLNMLDAKGYAGATQNERDHLLVEVMRRAFRDRETYLADPAFVKIPMDMLLSADHAHKLVEGLDMSRATPSSSLGVATPTSPKGTNTTHFSVLDRNGNRVAATLSLNLAFGCGFMPAGTGVVLNNEMDDFSSAPGVPNAFGLFGSDVNAIAPGKRPLSSMTPTFIEYNERIAILGSPGGSRIPGTVLITALGLLDAKDPQTAIALPRFHHQYLPDAVEAEPEFFGSARARQLRARGHVIESTGRNYGNVQLIVWDKAAGSVTATSDPRGIGASAAR